MKSYRMLLFLCLVPILGCGGWKANTQEKTETRNHVNAGKSDWTSIFNGKDLNGWTMKINGYPLGENFGNTFRVEDGILSIRYDAYGDDFNDRFGALHYDLKLSNYRLKIEYRFVGETAPGAPEWGYRDSGIQFYGQSPKSIKLNQRFPICLEYNLHGGNGKDERPVGQICANGMFVEINGTKNTSYCTPPKIKRTFHGDQWATLEIDVKDGQISHFVNGEEIIRYSNPTFNPNHEIAKTFIANGDVLVKDGYISLQSNSHPIDFRKIDIKLY